MTTNREIEKEIQDRTGLTGVRVSKAQGMCRFYSDNDISVDLSLTDAVRTLINTATSSTQCIPIVPLMRLATLRQRAKVLAGKLR